MKTKLSRVNKIILIMILTITVIMVGYIVFKKNMKDCAGCENCDYKAFTKTVFISSFEMDENDKLFQINFSAEGNDGNGSMWIDRSMITEAKLDTLKLGSLKNKNIHYQVIGKAIIKGTCKPYIIKKIVYLK